MAGDAYDKNFSNGMTMFNSETARNLTFVTQHEQAQANEIQILTDLKDQHGNDYRHVVVWQRGSGRLQFWTEFTNRMAQPVKLDYLSSFVLNSIAPFYDQIPAGTVDLLRLRSKWSMEGRIERRPIEMYDLEPSWKPSGLALVQFGQNGTMPVRRFFPLIGMADHRQHVLWLATVEASASWQLNAARLDEDSHTLILADLFGGSMANAAVRLAAKPNVRLITGLNLALALQAVLEKPWTDDEINKLIGRARENVREVTIEPVTGNAEEDFF